MMPPIIASGNSGTYASSSTVSAHSICSIHWIPSSRITPMRIAMATNATCSDSGSIDDGRDVRLPAVYCSSLRNRPRCSAIERSLTSVTTSVRPVRMAQLITATPMTMPPTRPTVATAIARSAPSDQPRSSNTGIMPAAVPWPPSNPISMSAPAIGVMPNSGVSTATASNRPTTYCPDANATPTASCGPARLYTDLGPGSFCPRNRVANTTEISRPGSVFHTDSTSSPKTPPDSMNSPTPPPIVPPSMPSTSGPSSRATKPPMIDAGRNSFCVTLIRIRMTLPMNSINASSSSANPTMFADIRTSFRHAPPVRGGACFAFLVTFDLNHSQVRLSTAPAVSLPNLNQLLGDGSCAP